MLRVIETHDHGQQWLGVADIMRTEARQEASAMLARFAARSNGIAGITPECVSREGEPHEQILKLIEEDEDIAVLVLAAAVDSEGPGPLVSSLGRIAGNFPIPVAIVPGHLTDEELDAMS
jgi:nucleotide-binding universal stress UspA family protein